MDSLHNPNANKSWWEVNWLKAVQWIAFAVMLIASVVLLCIPGTQAIGIAMLTMGAKAAISGLLIGGVICGVVSAIQCNDFWDGAVTGAIYGAINGFTTGAIMGLAQGLQAANQAVGAANAAKAKPTPIEDLGDNLQYQGERHLELDFKAGQVLSNHNSKHGNGLNSKSYLKRARKFLDGPISKNTRSFVSKGGTYFRYNFKTNEFGIINKYGGISTYMKPDNGIYYWIQQIAKYQ